MAIPPRNCQTTIAVLIECCCGRAFSTTKPRTLPCRFKLRVEPQNPAGFGENPAPRTARSDRASRSRRQVVAEVEGFDMERFTPMQLDLASFDSVKSFAQAE